MLVATATKSPENKQENLRRKKYKQENLRRRKMTLLRKVHELAVYGVDVALIIRQNGRFLTYRSLDHESWPPSMEQIVRRVSYLVPKNMLLRDMESQPQSEEQNF